MFKAIMKLYRSGRITKAGVALAVARGIISAAEYEEITGEEYAAQSAE